MPAFVAEQPVLRQHKYEPLVLELLNALCNLIFVHLALVRVENSQFLHNFIVGNPQGLRRMLRDLDMCIVQGVEGPAEHHNV